MPVTREQLIRAHQRHQAIKAWRASIPWTNEQIAQAWDQMADEVDDPYLERRYRRAAKWLRENDPKLSGAMLRNVLQRLIVTCSCCDKRAFYRVGVHGYCRDHKDLALARRKETDEHLQSEWARSGIYEGFRDFERLDRDRRQFKQVKRGHGRRR